MTQQPEPSAIGPIRWPSSSAEPGIGLARPASSMMSPAEAPEDTGQPMVRDRIGLDANRPINPKTGEIEPQVADPDIIADTGAGWVRLNFILGPWSSPLDRDRHSGRTWAETYEQIITGFRKKGLNIYGLIGSEAMPMGPGDRFRSTPPASDAADSWLDQYVEHFSATAQLFRQDVWVLESFNEPDDWQGQQRNLIHPGWFAIMLQRIWDAVRARSELNHVKLISGPLQGLQANNNAAAYYLQSTYRAGKRMFGWGRDGQPFPFHGVGYHLYVRQEFNPYRQQREQAVRVTCARFLGAMHRVIRQEEGQDKPLYVSELGWSSTVENRELRRREEYQADCLRTSLETLMHDPLVELGVWFCTLDFKTRSGNAFYGLYRAGDPTPDGRKPAFQAFRKTCELVPGEASAASQGVPMVATNRQIIGAFYRAAVELEQGDRWALLGRAGLELRSLVAHRQAVYEGQPVEALAGLTDEEKALVQSKLDALLDPGISASGAADLMSGLQGQSSGLAPQSDPGIEPDLDLALALQEHVLQELERNNQLLESALTELASQGREGPDLSHLLAAIGVFTFMIALAVSVVVVVLLSLLLP